MLDRCRSVRIRFVFAMLYALAMVAVGFAHRSVAAVPTEMAQAETYALPGGLDNVLCLAASDAGKTRHLAPCEACLLTAAAGLGTAPAPGLILPEHVRQMPWPGRQTVAVGLLRHAPVARGPPSVAFSV